MHIARRCDVESMSSQSGLDSAVSLDADVPLSSQLRHLRALGISMPAQVSSSSAGRLLSPTVVATASPHEAAFLVNRLQLRLRLRNERRHIPPLAHHRPGAHENAGHPLPSLPRATGSHGRRLRPRAVILAGELPFSDASARNDGDTQINPLVSPARQMVVGSRAARGNRYTFAKGLDRSMAAHRPKTAESISIAGACGARPVSRSEAAGHLHNDNESSLGRASILASRPFYARGQDRHCARRPHGTQATSLSERERPEHVDRKSDTSDGWTPTTRSASQRAVAALIQRAPPPLTLDAMRQSPNAQPSAQGETTKLLIAFADSHQA
ncbi:hypothetical protein EVG20_g11129 [Dentipellis fragilis]|uniref:Uncharacterized protein n=1 Tax=Dentipellis fragilis TaxID=205917 RepID=A0A4Y9XP68_9AGAM|nr:hypothetical protein EVG20_g11129 [Dentipellis fragilis]